MQNEKNNEINENIQPSENGADNSKLSFSGKDIVTILKTALILIVITAVSALMLAVLNSVTTPVIEERNALEKAQAIEELFGAGMQVDRYLGEIAAPVSELLIVSDASGALAGYCVSSSPKGFNAGINLLIAVSPGQTISGMKVLSLSETPDIGTKVTGESFIAQFAGLSAGITPDGASNGIDTISGATVSSKAVLAGVNAALEAVAKLVKLSGEEVG